MTYLKRYALSSMLGVAADKDDDGQAAGERKPQQKNVSGPGSGKANNAGAGKAPAASIPPAGQGTPTSDAPSREQLLLELSSLMEKHNVDENNIRRTVRMRYGHDEVDQLPDADLADLVGRVRKSVESANA